MDEVDIDNAEDLNELEARLYAQIHHETTNEHYMSSGMPSEANCDKKVNVLGSYKDHVRNNINDYEVPSNTNRILSKRYWSDGKNSAILQKHQTQPQQQNFGQSFTPNSPKFSSQQNYPTSFFNKTQNQRSIKQNENQSTFALKTNEQNTTMQNNKNIKTNMATVSPIEQKAISLSSNFESKKIKNAFNRGNQKLFNTRAEVKSNFKLNPVADWMKRKKNQANKKANNNNYNLNWKNSKNPAANTKGPFVKQQQKLDKFKRIEDKKQKSLKVRNAAAVITSKKKPIEIIDLDSADESSSSDVIMIPTAPPPTFTVDDSGEEDDSHNVPKILAHEDNALDSTDVQMSSTTSSFIKPQEITVQSLATVPDSSDKRLETSSRCTSPCSIQSSDDFIEQNDRSRLLAGASGVADDEDLLVLTSDMNSLLEAPQKSKEEVGDSENVYEKEVNLFESSVEQEKDSVEKDNSLEFVTPKTSKLESRSKDYRVDQSQFRAIDVYDSESDITDSFYSKGAPKSTVIRKVDSSSDEAENISIYNQKTKRLRKRRASSSNKGSDTNNGNSVICSDIEMSEEDDIEDDNDVLRTAIPFIVRGPAVERCKPGKRSRTLSSSSPIFRKRKSLKNTSLPGYMSDTEFVATLNNLAQGQDVEDKANRSKDELEESETENIPTARDIAEKILIQHGENEKSKKTTSDDMALPDDVLNELDKVFESIDQLDKHDTQKLHSSSPGNAFRTSDSSESDIENNVKYRHDPYDNTQIIQHNIDSKKYAKNGSPIYNIIYCRGEEKPGGIGWNEEMRKFYNDSWNGEQFTLRRILQKMNPDKNLWKINTEDRLTIKSKRHNNLKCTNCCDYGHVRSKCKKPAKPVVCYMCGYSGHHEPRCPKTICLRCGNKTQVFTRSCNACSFQNRLICPICKIRGHSLDYCPDKWRRYHSTTEPNSYPNSNVNYNPRKNCCICGGLGHLSDNCRSAVRYLQYPVFLSTVKSHQKSYNDVPTKSLHNIIGLNLMYEPCQEYAFDIVKRTTCNKYYGRFLKAVGLDFMLKYKDSQNSVTTEIADTTADNAKHFSRKEIINQAYSESTENAPNQVQEITESGSTDVQDDGQIIDLEDNNIYNSDDGNEIELVGSTVEDIDMENIQLNVINEKPSTAELKDENFKPPNHLASTSTVVTVSNPETEPSHLLDSDSNYSFSEHFDVPPATNPLTGVESTCTDDSRPRTRAVEALPDFIPLIDTSKDMKESNSNSGIFVAAESDEEMGENRRSLSPSPEVPCEAKIYLTHFHSKYLLSPVGNEFLVKASKAQKLKARLDFTSVGYVLVIFGLPDNQDKFQKELLLKYRELADEGNQKQMLNNLNIPKRTDVLIKFLRENIMQLLTNLGNANHLLRRLQFLERQQSKTGSKLAEKVRRSLNMILVGQAGLKDGSMHLDKLLMNLKTLLDDFAGEDVTPPQLRSEITDHWKVIFSSYRHENYKQLVDAYNKMVSKNRIPKLNIDPILLGQKVLDTSFTEEQKQRLEQSKPSVIANTELTRCVPLNQKNSKALKRKQSASASNMAVPPNKTKISVSRPDSPAKILQTPISIVGADNIYTSTAITTQSASEPNFNISSSSEPIMMKTGEEIVTSFKTKTFTFPSSLGNKLKQTYSTSTTSTNTLPTTSKKQAQKLMPPPPFSNPEKWSAVCTTVQDVSGKWKHTCDSLLTEISGDTTRNISKPVDCSRTQVTKSPSTFWSQESMRYLDDCVRLVAAKSNIVEKLKRVQNKSKNGQLSYNDYLAVIKLHTALSKKCKKSPHTICK